MSDGLSAAVLNSTRRFWAKRTGEIVSAEDAAESIRNVAGLFDLLAGWAARADGEYDVDTVARNTPETSRREVSPSAGQQG